MILLPPEIEAVVPATQPLLKWAGGKRWAVPYIEPLWRNHSHRRFADPFCGALAMPLALSPTKALLGDVDRWLIQFHKCFQVGEPRRWTIPLEFGEEAYYAARSRFNSLLDLLKPMADEDIDFWEGAQLLLYLNKTGFNGLHRFNKHGHLNTPAGRTSSGKPPTLPEDFSEYQQAVKGWTFFHGDFREFPLEAADFLYLDPPYDDEVGGRSFNSYGSGAFGWARQVELAEWAAAHSGPVVLHNRLTPRIKELYEGLGFTVNSVPEGHCVGAKVSARKVIPGAIAVKNI